MEGLIITILKQGSFAFLGSKLTKVLGQKEISDFIAASGWAVVGVSAVNAVIPLIKWFQRAAEDIESLADKLSFLK